MDLNKCFLAGRMVRDPEVRFTTNGSAVAQFTIAINRRWKSETGEKKEDVAYLDCKAFGKSGENIAQYFRKGSQIMVEARATTEAWEDKATKEKRGAIRFVVDQWHFVDGKEDGATPPAARAVQPPKAKEPVEVGTDAEGDPLPF